MHPYPLDGAASPTGVNVSRETLWRGYRLTYSTDNAGVGRGAALYIEEPVQMGPNTSVAMVWGEFFWGVGG